MTILDNGGRREFDSGAVRDIQQGKGRCDLLPLDIISQVIDIPTDVFYPPRDIVIADIWRFMQHGHVNYLITAAQDYAVYAFGNVYTAVLELSIHFEEGCNKYGEHNWQKGIPVKCYIDSAVRHYMKAERGDKDENHKRAVLWNLVCAAWTVRHKPELNEYRREKE